MVASYVPPTGDQAHNPGMCPDWESNRRPFGLQACTQSTEPHQPGLDATLMAPLTRSPQFLRLPLNPNGSGFSQKGCTATCKRFTKPGFWATASLRDSLGRLWGGNPKEPNPYPTTDTLGDGTNDLTSEAHFLICKKEMTIHLTGRVLC